MGATLFFGLTFVALITQGVPETEYANPAETMSETQLDAPPKNVSRVAQMSWPLPVVLADTRVDETHASPLAEPTTAEAQATLTPPPAAPPSLVATFPDNRQVPQTAGQDVQVALPGQTVERGRVAVLGNAQGPGDAGPVANAETATQPGVLAEFDDAPIAARIAPNDVQVAAPDPVDQRPPFASLGRVATSGEGRQLPDTQPSQRLSAQTQLDQGADRPAIPSLQLTAPDAPTNAPVLTAPRLTTLLPDSPPAPQAQPEPARVDGDFVFLRTEPNGNAEPLGQFDTGTEVLIHEVRGTWRRVEIDGQIGWMFGRYLVPRASQ